MSEVTVYAVTSLDDSSEVMDIVLTAPDLYLSLEAAQAAVKAELEELGADNDELPFQVPTNWTYDDTPQSQVQGTWSLIVDYIGATYVIYKIQVKE